MKRKVLPRSIVCLSIVLILFIVINQGLFATTGDLPFEAPLQKILDSITGPVAKILATLAVVGVGLAMAFGEMGGAMKRLINIVFGISLVFAAVTFVPSFFGFTGGILW